MNRKPACYFIILLASAILFTTCRPDKQEPVSAQNQGIADTITELMTQITAYAENANADSAFLWLSEDPDAIYMTGGMAYSYREVVSKFRHEYGNIKRQKIEPIHTRVIVFSPSAAAWIFVGKGTSVSRDDQLAEQLLEETWLWQRGFSGWNVVHYHESYLAFPDACKKATVEFALKELSKELSGRPLTPAGMPAILTSFLKNYPIIYGASLAFAPKAGKKHVAAPYIYRQSAGFKQVNLPESFDYTQSEWYAKPVSQKAPSWSNPYYDDGGGGVVMVTYSVPMYDQAKNLIGVLTSDVEMK